jgi:Na+/H+ antiporter NhaA
MLTFLIFVFAFLGGIVRGLAGFIKHQFAYKSVSFKWKYFLGMSLLSGVIGFVVVAAVKDLGFTYNNTFGWSLAVIIGYAGGDFIENIYKIIIKKSSFGEKEEGK